MFSCRSHGHPCFPQRPWGVLLSSPFVIILCSYMRYQRRLRPIFSSFFSPFRPLYIPQIFLVCSPCFPFCVTSSPWVLSFVPLWETLLPGPSLRTAPKWNYGICSCISRVFLRELGFTVFTILTGDLFAKFDEMCWTTLIASFWGSNEFQRTYSTTGRYGRFSIFILKFNSTARTQSNEHVSSRARNVPNFHPQKTAKTCLFDPNI